MSDDRMFALTLDLENDWYFEDPALDHLVFEHLDEFIDLIREFDIPVSVFVVGRTLEKYPEEIDRLQESIDCEFHLHSYQHDMTKSYDFETEVRQGMEVFRDHFGQDPTGYRAPQGKTEPREFDVLADMGFSFDSSIIPSYRPGTYNNLNAPLEPYHPGDDPSFVEIPVGAFRGIRIPLAHSYFKLIGRPLSTLLSIAPLPDVAVYMVHLQDLYRTASHDALETPKRWIMKRNLDNAIPMFRANIETILSRGFEPMTMTEICAEFRQETDVESSPRCTQVTPTRP